MIHYSNGTTETLGVVVGAPGQDGVDGTDGIGIAKTEIDTDGQLIITYTDNTTATLGVVVGANGQNGADGADGVGVATTIINANGELVISYTDGTTQTLGKVVGTNGVPGADGKDGTDGADGTDGIGITESEINAAGELVLTYTNGTTANLGVVVGSDGRNGADGTNGVNGTDGVGISGASINDSGELVLTFSNDTTVNLGCIVGKNGADGANGKDGSNGANGADGVGIADVTISADGILSVELTNDTTLNLGNVKGADGIGISASAINEDGELVLTYTNGTSTNLGKVVGSNGTNGTDGKNGTDGVGISNVTISDAGVLNVTLTNGSVINLGNIKGADGNGISKSEIVGGELVLTYTDGTTANLGNVIGSNGTNGAPGKDGADGVGIQTVTISDDGQLVVTLTDGSVQIAGSVKGDKGDKGDQGEQGIPGRGVEKIEIKDGHMWVTYTDDPETPVDAGSVSNQMGEGIVDGDFAYVLLDDGTYGVRASKEFALSEVVIPANYNGIAVTQILENGFKNQTGITSVVFPDSLARIGRYAFQGCTGLTVVNIPIATKFIGAYAFYGSGLTSATLDTTTPWLSGDSDFSYEYYRTWISSGSGAYGENRAEVTIKQYDISVTGNAAAALSSPVSEAYLLKEYGSTGSSEYRTFYWFAQDWTNGTDFSTAMPYILGVHAGEGIVGETGPQGEQGNPGADGRGIAGMEIVDGELIVTYTDGTTQNLGSIPSFSPNSADYLVFTELSDGTYEVGIKDEYKSTATSITIPGTYNGKSVTKIAANGFEECAMLQSVVMPDTITEIGDYAFRWSGALVAVDFSDNLVAIGVEAFAYTSLSEFWYEGVQLKTIGNRAFAASNIKRANVPSSVTYIGAGAFDTSTLKKISVDTTKSWYCMVDGSKQTISGSGLMLDSFVSPGSGTYKYPNFKKAYYCEG